MKPSRRAGKPRPRPTPLCNTRTSFACDHARSRMTKISVLAEQKGMAQFSPTNPSWRFLVSSRNPNSYAHQLRRAAPPSTQAVSSGPLPSQWQRRVRASPASLWSYRTSDSKVRAPIDSKKRTSSQLFDARDKRGSLGSYFNRPEAEFSTNHRNDYTVRKA